MTNHEGFGTGGPEEKKAGLVGSAGPGRIAGEKGPRNVMLLGLAREMQCSTRQKQDGSRWGTGRLAAAGRMIAGRFGEKPDFLQPVEPAERFARPLVTVAEETFGYGIRSGTSFH
jgi:hypothetical protein